MTNETAVRILQPGDEELAERFLLPRTASSMFLRANLGRGGLRDEGKRLQGTWAAAIEGGEVVSVAAHFWNGNLALQAPRELDAVARAAVAASGRQLLGLIGPLEQVERARVALGRVGKAKIDTAEVLYLLELSRHRVPEAISSGEVRVRLGKASDVEALAPWRHDFAAEALGDPPGPELLERSRYELELTARDGSLFVAEASGVPVSMCTFNARLPEVAQVGGVWTPRGLRSRGYGRAIVSGALLLAQAEGVRQAVLFTQQDNAPARRAYEALGFEKIGDYGLVLL